MRAVGKKKLMAAIMMTVFLFSLMAITEIENAQAESTNIVVPTDYSSIQEAINAATDGDTVFVKRGTYHEILVLNKTISLIGEDRDTTIVEAQVTINHSNVTIAGFTIQHATQYISGVTSFAVDVYTTASYCSILGNRIRENDNGVRIIFSSNNNIIGNIIESNTFNSIKLSGGNTQGANYNRIQGNKISNSMGGIELRYDCINNSITGNNISQCSDYGVNIVFAGSNVFSENNISNSGCGIRNSGNMNAFFHNNYINNTQQVNNTYFEFPTGEWRTSVGTWYENFWSDYNGADANADGEGDAPYIIDANNTDSYPLMAPIFVPVATPSSSTTSSPSPIPSPTLSPSQTLEPSLEPTPTPDNNQKTDFTAAILGGIAVVAVAVAAALVYLKRRR